MVNFTEQKTAPQVTVEQIHAEFDSGEERILAECNEILKTLNLIPESHIERKGKMLAELGFSNSEPARQFAELDAKNKEIEKRKMIAQSQAESILYFKNKYPYSKFITVNELNRICDKYGLIHAPVGNYIKDVPEKNVLEMSNRVKLDSADIAEDEYRLVGLKSDYLLNLFGKTEPVFTLSDLDRINYPHKYALREWFLDKKETWAYVAVNHGVDENNGVGSSDVRYMMYGFDKIEKTGKNGLCIAAPPSHFNLEGLTKSSEFGYFNVESFEVKDPVVFEYCKNNIVRIITKWGTDDDQSHLDSSLTNEVMN